MSGSILTSLLKRLSTSTQRASSSSSSAEQELHNLKNTMKMIHSILEDAEERDRSNESEQLRLQELKEVAYDAEDVLDEYEYQVLHMKIEARRQAAAASHKVLFDWNSFHPKVSISDELAGKIIEIRKRFEEINDWKRIGLSLLEKGQKRRCIIKWNPIETTSYFDEATILGREDEKNEIMKWLLQEEEGGDALSVLVLVGMGGLGKTTLAQMIYNDTIVQQHFNLKGWVYVSEYSNATNLAKKIYNSFGSHKSANFMGLDELRRALKVVLKERKFFLVLDDVWNIEFELWSSLKTLLVDGVGKILVTSREDHFVKVMQKARVIYLSPLSFNDSWLLFKKIAYGGQDRNFLEVGKKIVAKCRGLPLAIKVLAGILSMEDEEEAWVELLESGLWDLDKEEDGIFPVLKLSYDRLPVELKTCFAYLCLFPKGSHLSKSVIVQQWISHGFIQPRGNKIEEDVGNDYCNEFLHRSLLQYGGKIFQSLDDYFIMHDLIHDLAQSVGKAEYMLMTAVESNHMIPKTIRHVSVYIKDKDNKLDTINLEPLCEAKQLRTLILQVMPSEHTCRGIPITDLLGNLTSLRTLVCDAWNGEEFPNFIGSMKHLRYLSIGPAKSFPTSVYNLHHLRTFASYMLKIDLSREIGDLINLRHLNMFGQYHLPHEVVGLTNLQTLREISLGVESDGSESFKIRDLKGLSNLRGHLEVAGLETVTWPEVTPLDAYLKDKPGIQSLRLSWRHEAEERLAAQVLDSLQPHGNLKIMKIIYYAGDVLPAWLGLELPALEKLVIAGTRAKTFAQPIQKKSYFTEDVESRRLFPSLKELTMEHMHGLEEWQGGDYRDFPCLGELTIDTCPKLRTLPSLSHLHTLFIINCRQLRSLPSLPSLTELLLFTFDLFFDCSCLPMLRFLRIYCYSGDSLNFGKMDLIEKLYIMGCSALRSMQGLGDLPSLQHLLIDDCPLLRISTDECLPPKLQDVKITESPGAEEWYQNHVLGVSECQATTQNTEKMTTT